MFKVNEVWTEIFSLNDSNTVTWIRINQIRQDSIQTKLEWNTKHNILNASVLIYLTIPGYRETRWWPRGDKVRGSQHMWDWSCWPCLRRCPARQSLLLLVLQKTKDERIYALNSQNNCFIWRMTSKVSSWTVQTFRFFLWLFKRTIIFHRTKVQINKKCFFFSRYFAS